MRNKNFNFFFCNTYGESCISFRCGSGEVVGSRISSIIKTPTTECLSSTLEISFQTPETMRVRVGWDRGFEGVVRSV